MHDQLLPGHCRYATSPANTDSMAYDGEGNRVALTVVSPTSTKTTVYVGMLADYTTKGTSTSHVNHYSFAGQLVALRDSTPHDTDVGSVVGVPRGLEPACRPVRRLFTAATAYSEAG